MSTATKIAEARDGDYLAARRTADYIIHLLDDFIPRGSRQEAWELLMKTSIEHGMELTNPAMRKQYEAWKSTQIESLLLTPTPFVTQEGSR